MKAFTVICRNCGKIANCDFYRTAKGYASRHSNYNDCDIEDIGVINNYDTTNIYIGRGV